MANTTGLKFAGRVKGTPNKRTSLVEQKLKEMDCDPFAILARVAMDPEAATKDRVRAAAELANYIAPRRKAVEVTGVDPNAGLPVIEVRWIEVNDGPSGNEANGSGRLPPSIPPSS